MDTLATVATFPPNTLGTNAFLFMAAAWFSVLTLLLWSYFKLMSTPQDEKLPPPGSIP